MIRTKFTISLHEVALGLLQPLNPVIELRLLKMVPNDSLYPKNMGLDTKIKSPVH